MLPTYHFFFFKPFQETNNFFVLGIWKPQLGQTKYLIVAALYIEVFHYGFMCSHYKFNECIVHYSLTVATFSKRV